MRSAAPRSTFLRLSIRAVIFDRDGTLVPDVPYNGDPSAVRAEPEVVEGLRRLRERGLKLAVVSNQSGIGRGMLSFDQVEAVNRRIDELLGPFDLWLYCPHAPQDDCECRKPKPKLILDAANAFGVDPAECLVIGDKVSDVEAAQNAGARSLFVGESAPVRDAVERLLRELA